MVKDEPQTKEKCEHEMRGLTWKMLGVCIVLIGFGTGAYKLLSADIAKVAEKQERLNVQIAKSQGEIDTRTIETTRRQSEAMVDARSVMEVLSALQVKVERLTVSIETYKAALDKMELRPKGDGAK